MNSEEFRGRIGQTVHDSEPWWPESTTGSTSRPNVVLVVLDDTGWADLGCFGSEINTPTIDALAADGARYTQFHVTPVCSPTRASLLTGRNSHRLGMRSLAHVDTGFPNARGRVTRSAAMLPRVLRDHGYASYLVGKWHLAPSHETSPVGPYQDWPLARGFDRFYGFLDGCTDQYTPELVEDNSFCDPPMREGYHLAEDMIDRANRYITDRVTLGAGPFFLQVAFGATHAPFQVPREYVEKYVDVFAKGWDRTRTDRLNRQIEMGLMPRHTQLTDRNPGVPAWETLGDDERTVYTHLQAAYAGFLDHADTQLGKLVAHLERLGVRDDTVVVVMSDNGASGEGRDDGGIDTMAPYNGHIEPVPAMLGRLHHIGGPEGGAHYPRGWAMAGNTPFQLYKQFTDAGGVRSPLVISWPSGPVQPGTVRSPFLHVADVTPTLLDLLGIEPPRVVDGVQQLPVDGRSFAATFRDADAVSRTTQRFESFGHRAVWNEGWKAVAIHEPGTPFDQDQWRLYDTVADSSESNNLAETRPDKLDELVRLWWDRAEEQGLLPLDDRSMKELLESVTPGAALHRARLTFRIGQSHVQSSSGICGSNRSIAVSTMLDASQAARGGVVLASGTRSGGYTMYIADGAVVYEHVYLQQRTVVRSEAVLPGHPVQLEWRVARRADESADVTLSVDGTPVARGKVPVTAGQLSFWGIDVGRDAASQVSDSYPVPGEFPLLPAAADEVVLELLEDADRDEVAMRAMSEE